MERELIKSLVLDNKDSDKARRLIEAMDKLKGMDLLSGKELNKVVLPGVIKPEHVYNDYHARSTNAGYSRGDLGRIFSKWLLISIIIVITILPNVRSSGDFPRWIIEI